MGLDFGPLPFGRTVGDNRSTLSAERLGTTVLHFLSALLPACGPDCVGTLRYAKLKLRVCNRGSTFLNYPITRIAGGPTQAAFQRVCYGGGWKQWIQRGRK